MAQESILEKQSPDPTEITKRKAQRIIGHAEEATDLPVERIAKEEMEELLAVAAATERANVSLHQQQENLVKAQAVRDYLTLRLREKYVIGAGDVVQEDGVIERKAKPKE